MPYRIDVRDAPGDALERLIDLGALDVDSTRPGTVAALMPDGVTPGQIAEALGPARIEVSPAAGRDAESIWILRPGPVTIGGLRIVPADAPAEAGALRMIDAPAFGTGLHPTTALCIEAVEQILDASPADAVLDVGTGSGILALGALLLGVPQALAIDTDPEALRAAAANARLNGLEGRLRLGHGGPETVPGRWPLVLANILPAPLVEMAPVLARRVGHRGFLVLSGMTTSLQADVHDAYRHLGMRRTALDARAGWSALVMQATW